MANETMDFLSALASRNGLDTGKSPLVVQPRIPSRFEPVAPEAGTGLIESSTEIDAVQDTRRNLTRSEGAPAFAPAASPTPAINLSAPPAALLTPSTHLALREIERVVHERETQTIRVVERERPTPSTSAPANTASDSPGTAPSPQQSGAQPAIPAPPLQPIQPVTVLAPKPVATKPAPQKPEPAQMPATQPPDVYINIGRIEVRANAPKKSEPARPKPNAPNLERYLNLLSGAGDSGGDG